MSTTDIALCLVVAWGISLVFAGMLCWSICLEIAKMRTALSQIKFAATIKWDAIAEEVKK